jgi:hypothetical protein
MLDNLAMPTKLFLASRRKAKGNKMTEATYNDMTETFIGTGRNDSKGREIGWIVGLNNNGVDFAAWVQNARKVNGNWKEFGVQQRSRSFPSQATATAWAYATAQVRRHKFLTK